MSQFAKNIFLKLLTYTPTNINCIKSKKKILIKIIFLFIYLIIADLKKIKKLINIYIFKSFLQIT
ncbi:hypothetical protein AAJ76_260009147 [Vairimorpha ceranae]|uniref:Uncharacterized protein n=1 Tax=Vairimorpha ceranae TaxID=40302 RepID=A0A0F9ZC94_9MICR|nr:hypothetical protein AAJ76_260009147 [Vairimorpha ceranae]KKO75264.1 hypothetical protein AAJ76_260009147 [Vairimorpha ceranae]